MWEYHDEIQPDGTVHSWPLDDGIEHELVGTDCPCGPRLQHHDNGVAVAHRSLDGRELIELGLWPPE